jgi:DNA replication protein DnaC
MALYKTAKYADQINETWPDEIRTAFDMLKRQTQNFTIENAGSKQIDESLILSIENHLDDNASNSSIRKVTRQFEQLFKNLEANAKNNGGGGNGKVDEKQVREIIERELKKNKIDINNLTPELKALINETRLIRYELPGQSEGQAPKPVKLRDIAIKIIDDLRIGNNVMLIGGAGTGKTFLSKQIAHEVWGKPPKVINCSQWTSPTEIVGGFSVDGYEEGKLIEAYRDGHILLLDELPKLDPNTAGLLNDALSNTRESGREAIIQNAKGDNIEKHPDFACIATGNVYPNSTDIAYAANNKQDLSLLDRFSGSVYFIQKDAKFEKKRIGIRFIWNTADEIRNTIEKNNWEAQMSLRWMIGARNIFIREWERYNNHRNDGLKSQEGVTFAEYLDKYLGTFTEEQQTVLKKAISYNDVLYDYRNNLNSDKYDEFTKEEINQA